MASREEKASNEKENVHTGKQGRQEYTDLS